MMKRTVTIEDITWGLVGDDEAIDLTAVACAIEENPLYADAIRAFVAEWVRQDVADPTAERDEAMEQRVADRAMSRLLDAEWRSAGRRSDPFDSLDAAGRRSLATAVGVDVSVLVKLERRKITAETIPARMTQALARELQIEPMVITQHLRAAAVAPAHLEFSAPRAPRIDGKEPFAQAIRASGLSDDKKAEWLALCGDGD